MASMRRTIKRAHMFKRMNKQQRRLWKAQHGKKAVSNVRHINSDFAAMMHKEG